VAFLTGPTSFTTRETVAMETLAFLATSSSFMAPDPLEGMKYESA
jgi:hypothetical protein